MCTVCSDARRVTCLVMNNDTRLEMNETEKELEVPWEDIDDKWDDGVVVRAHGRLPERASASDRHALGQRDRLTLSAPHVITSVFREDDDARTDGADDGLTATPATTRRPTTAFVSATARSRRCVSSARGYQHARRARARA